MATSSKVQPSEMECPVCHENFNTPKILPCAHLLCRHCLVMWLCSETDALCPLCRAPIAHAEQRATKKASDIADRLPTDLAMEAVVECAAILDKSHECCGCRRSPAVCVCLSCSDMMCAPCSVIHRNMSTGRHHEVEDLATMTPERLSAVRRPPCSLHADRPSELYCPSHGAVICQLCATSKHRACPEVMELDEKMQEARGILRELASILKAGESKLEGAISELDQYVLDADKATQAALADIDQKCDRLQTSVEALRKRAKDQVKGANSEAKDVVGEAKGWLLDRRGKMTSHDRLIERVSQTMPRVYAVGDSTSRLQNRVHDIDLSVELPKDFKAITLATLTLEKQALERVENELAQMGQLTRIKVPLIVQPTYWSFHTNHEASVVLSNMDRTAERVTKDSVSLVLSSQPMDTGCIYQVEVEEKDSRSSRHFLPCGVYEDDPAILSFKHKLVESKMARVIGEKGVWDRGIKTNKQVGGVLMDLPVGSRVGVLMDTANSLHLYVDGQHQGVAARNIRRPCHAVFYIPYSYRKITTCPWKMVW